MTADNDTPLLPVGEAASSANPALIPAPAKKSPRRKVAVRPKLSVVVTAADSIGTPTEETVKVSRPRRKKAVQEPLVAVAAESPTESTSVVPPAAVEESKPAQPRILSSAEVGSSKAPEAQVETRVIPRDLMSALEKRTRENFPHPADKAAQTPVIPERPAVAAVEPPPTGALPARTDEVPPPANVQSSPASEPEGKPVSAENPAPIAPGLDGAAVNQGDERRFEADSTGSQPNRTESSTGPGDERRFERSGQPFQGRRNDHRNQGRGDFQQRGDYQQGRGGDHQQGRGDHQQGRGGQQGFRQQGGQQGYQGGQGQRPDQGQRSDQGQRPDQGQRSDQGQRFDQQGQRPEQGPRLDQQPQQGGGSGEALVTRVTETQYGEGIIEVSGKGFGFLREAKRNFVQTPADVFVTPEVCRKYNLRDGQWIKGEIRRSSRGPQLFRLTALNGDDPEKFRNLPNFEELTSINPKKRIKLETVPERYTTRVIDLMTPIGKGQRGLIVAPPRTGKTTLLQHIAEAVVKNHAEMKLIILLVDERPEEVTEIRRSVPGAEVMASSNDSDLKSHTRIAQLAIERAKRLVEAGQDVFILLDSITRMARAFNNSMSGGGRGTASGGLAVGALEIPRKIFAAARNTEEAGSLTIMATALIETNSKMDDAIFQEFKGTGNMELVLDRKISDQRIYPAVDIFLSGTRREELLLQGWELDKINVIRRGLAGHKPIEAIERLLSFLKKFPTNTQMLASLPG